MRGLQLAFALLCLVSSHILAYDDKGEIKCDTKLDQLPFPHRVGAAFNDLFYRYEPSLPENFLY